MKQIKTGPVVLILTALWLIGLYVGARIESMALFTWAWIPMVVAFWIMVTHDRPSSPLFRGGKST